MEQAATLDDPAEMGASTGRSLDHSGGVAPNTPPPARVTLRYWAAVKAAAGTARDEVSGSTVAEVLVAARELHVGNPKFAEVLSVCSFLLGDRPLGTAELAEIHVTSGDVVDVLPPFAGG